MPCQGDADDGEGTRPSIALVSTGISRQRRGTGYARLAELRAVPRARPSIGVQRQPDESPNYDGAFSYDTVSSCVVSRGWKNLTVQVFEIDVKAFCRCI